MLFKTTLISAFALLAVNQVIGAIADVPRDVSGIQIATDSYSACNCPNNCSHRDGSGCKFYSGPSDHSRVFSGKCHLRDGKLICM